jgi:hypothetical protein
MATAALRLFGYFDTGIVYFYFSPKGSPQS